MIFSIFFSSNLEREKNRQKESELKREESQFERKKSVIYDLLEEYKNRDTSASKQISKKFEEFSPRYYVRKHLSQILDRTG